MRICAAVLRISLGLAAIFLLFLVSSPAVGQREETASPVALTPCELAALHERFASDAETRNLFRPIGTRALLALDLPPSPTARLYNVMESDPRFSLYERFNQDALRIEALGYAYAVERRSEYAERAGHYLRSWALTYRSDGHPISESEVVRMVRGYGLVASTLPGTERQLIERWFATIAREEIASQDRLGRLTAISNYQSHRLKIVGIIGYALGNAEYIRYAENGYRAQIAENLRPDGSSWDFHYRDSLQYHTYNLMPLVELAIAADRRGLDLYSYRSPSGASLERSLLFLLPYIRGEKIHYEFVRSQTDFDRQRATATGMAQYQVGAPWNPQRAASLMEMAGYFNDLFANEPIRGSALRTFQTVLNSLRLVCKVN